MGQYFHCVRIESEKCDGRMACLKACPTEAIRVRSGKATLLEDRCIDCGECARACPHGAIVPQTSSFTDFSRFEYTVAVASPVLYGQFGKEVLPHTILAGLRKIGFNDACDVACASEAVSIAIDEYLERYHGPLPLLSPFCPTVVRLIQARFPNLIDQLIPIDSPMEIAAREVKDRKARELGLRGEQIGAIYVTPCPAKMIAIKYPLRKRASHLDGVVAISDIYFPLLSAIGEMNNEAFEDEAIRGIGLGWPVLGGQVSSLRAESSLAVGGLADVERILEEVENGKLSDVQYVECQACPPGCCGGSLTVNNPYFARGKILTLVNQFGRGPCQEREMVRKLFQKKYFSLPGRIPTRPFAPLDKDIARAIEKRKLIEETYATLPKIDCGVCGAPTCRSFAEDVVLGRAAMEDCLVLAAKQAGREAGSVFRPGTVEDASVAHNRLSKDHDA